MGHNTLLYAGGTPIGTNITILGQILHVKFGKYADVDMGAQASRLRKATESMTFVKRHDG